MNSKTVRLILLILISLLVVQLAPAARVRVSPAAAQEGADLYMKDTPMDTGIEPNPDGGPMWVTEDIWVRTTPDPNYSPLPFAESSPPWTPLAHENPEYRDPEYSLPNYVYVRVRNRGEVASSGNERLRLYFAKASTGLSWPTQWVDYVVNNGTKDVLYGMEVTKPRENAATASPAERAAYVQAILDIGTAPGFVFPGGTTYWRNQDIVHQFGPANRHGSPAFLPWHREFINRYEVLLQEADPTVKLLYWDWTTDPENSGGFNFFTPSFMGASGRGTGGTSIGLPFSALGAPAVTRNLSTNTTPPAVPDATLLNNLINPTYQLFAPDIESSPNHNSAHGYVGGGGNLSYIGSAAEDPFFFLLHANVDRLWAQWQRDPANVTRLAAATAYDGNSANSNITTNMGPWDGIGLSGGSSPIRPWTVGDGYIVNKTPKHPSIVAPPIYDTAPLVIPALNPGEAAVIEIPWYPPNPADFASFGGDQGHFCLLARIETTSSAPFGMTTPETSNVSSNTRNNNNIVWKNVTVVDDFSGALRLTSILIRNIFREPVITRLRFANTDEIGSSFFEFGTISVELPPELFDRWVEGGEVGKGVEPVGESTLQIFSPDAFIGNMKLEPDQVFSVNVRFELNQDYEPQRGLKTKWDLIQLGTPGDPEAVVGGQRFEADFSKLVASPGGSEWRYLDNGTEPGAEWITLAFDDSRWKQGPAELGFGDNPQTTINGGPANNRHITAYFRRTFNVVDPSFYRSLIMRLKRDDGAVVYVNGKEVHRVNLPGGNISGNVLATREVAGLEEEMFFPFELDAGLLKEGANVVAVEVHQDSPSSPDLSFDLELLANLAETRFPPDLAFVTPFDGELFQVKRSIPIEVEALDSDGKIRAVSVYADGDLLNTDADAPYRFEWPGAPLGVHRLRAEAIDADGLRSTVDVTVTVVNNTPPIVALTAPVDGAKFDSTDTIRLAVEASDPGGAVQNVKFFSHSGGLFTDPPRLLATVEEAPYEFDLHNLAPGQYMINAVATDNRGATSSAVTAYIEVSGEFQARTYLPVIGH